MRTFVAALATVVVWAADQPPDDAIRIAYWPEYKHPLAYVYDTITPDHMKLVIRVPAAGKPGDTLGVFHLYPNAISQEQFEMWKSLEELQGKLLKLEDVSKAYERTGGKPR